jgi:hypothetical protein
MTTVAEGNLLQESLKIGDMVILKDQSQNMREGTIIGGVVKAIGHDYIVLYRHSVGFVTHRRMDVRKLTPDEIAEAGIHII